jgi:hypothetical protein
MAIQLFLLCFQTYTRVVCLMCTATLLSPLHPRSLSPSTHPPTIHASNWLAGWLAARCIHLISLSKTPPACLRAAV